MSNSGSINVIGGVTLSPPSAAPEQQGSVGGARLQRMLAALVIERNRAISLDRLTEIAFWGDDSHETASSTMRTYVYRLRRALESAQIDAQIETTAAGYRLEIHNDAVDLLRFVDNAERCAHLVEAGDHRAAIKVADQALTDWDGEPFSPFANEAWALAEVRRAEELRLQLEDLRSEAAMNAGDTRKAVAALEQLTAEAPSRERRWELLMLALAAEGRHGEALRAYARCREWLVSELGLDPSERLQQLEQRILEGDASLLDRSGEDSIRSYQLVELIDESNEARRWLASHESISHELWVLRLEATHADEVDFIKRFDSYMERVSLLEHPSINPTVDYWREPGAAFVISRALGGSSLANWVDDIDTAMAWNIADAVSNALAQAHAQGVVHGSVTSQFVHADASASWYLTGFGTPQAVVGQASLRDDLRDIEELLRTVAIKAGDPHLFGIPTGGWVNASSLLSTLAGLRTRRVPAGASPTAALVGRNPYVGLRSFGQGDASFFFGRTALVEQLVGDIERGSGLQVLIGSSGCGKSSLLHAGVIPALMSKPAENLRLTLRCTPTAAPFESLASALRQLATSTASVSLTGETVRFMGLSAAIDAMTPDGSSLLLVIDQLEELFELADTEDRNAILETVADVAVNKANVQVLAAIRSDALEGLLETPTLAPLLRNALVPIPPLTDVEVEEVIVQPCHAVGVDVDIGIIASATAEVAGQSTMLPHLQQALRTTFEESGGHLDEHVYRDLGGVGGALERSAEQSYSLLSNSEQDLLRSIVRRLVVVGRSGGLERERSRVADLPKGNGAGKLDGLLTQLVAARLIVLDHDPLTREPTVEIAHESLLRDWERLRSWASEDAVLAETHRLVTSRSRSWIELDRDESELLRGSRLEDAVAKLSDLEDDLSHDERSYLDASVALRDAKLVAERRTSSQLRRMLVGALVALLVAVAAGGLALVQRSAARENATEAVLQANSASRAADDAEAAWVVAERRAEEAELQRLLSSLGPTAAENPRRGVLLGAELHSRFGSDATRNLLLETLQRLPRGLERFLGEGSFHSAAVSADGALVAAAKAESVEMWQLPGGDGVAVEFEVTEAHDIAFADDVLLVAAGSQGVVRVQLDGTTKDILDAPFEVTAVFGTADLLLAGGAEGQVARWTGLGWKNFEGELGGRADRIHADASSGYTVGSSRQNGSTAVVWDLTTQESIGELRHIGSHDLINTLDAVVIDDTIASIGTDNRLTTWALPSLQPLRLDFVVPTALDVGPSGELVVATSSNQLETRRVDDLQVTAVFEASPFTRNQIAYGGSRAVAVPTDDGVEVWDLLGGHALAVETILDFGGLASYSAGSKDGLAVVTADANDEPNIEIFQDFEPTGLWAEFDSPDAYWAALAGKWVVSLLDDDVLEIHDFDTRRRLELPTIPATNARHDGSDSHLLVAPIDDSSPGLVMHVDNAGFLTELTDLESPLAEIISVNVADNFLVAATKRGDVAIWDADSLELVHLLEDPTGSRVVGSTSLKPGQLTLFLIDGRSVDLDLATGEITRELMLSPSGFPQDVSALPGADGLVITGGPSRFGGTARLWDADTGEQVGLAFDDVGVGALTYSEDWLFTFSLTVNPPYRFRWPINPDAWAPAACDIAGRSLSPDELADNGLESSSTTLC